MRTHLRTRSPISLALFAVFGAVITYLMAPLVLIVLNSFSTSTYGAFPPPSFTLNWYVNTLFHVPDFRLGFVNSMIVAAVSTALSVILGALAAYALTRYQFRRREVVRTVLMLPLLLPSIVVGASLFALFILLSLYGTLTGLVLSHALLNLPFVITIISANLKTFSPEYEEAAMDLGANGVRTFFEITLPNIRFGVMLATVLAFVLSFDQVDVSLFLARPNTMTLPIAMFKYTENYQDPTLAAVASLMILFAALVALVAIWLLTRSRLSTYL